MKRFFIFLFFVLFLINNNAFSSKMLDTSNFFIDNSNVNVVTVKKAKSLFDNSPIVLEGYLIRQIDDDEFIFKDGTDTIRVDIDDNVLYQFAHARITPNTPVRLYGSVDKEFLEETTADIFKLEIINNINNFNNNVNTASGSNL